MAEKIKIYRFKVSSKERQKYLLSSLSSQNHKFFKQSRQFILTGKALKIKYFIKYAEIRTLNLKYCLHLNYA